MVKSLGMTVLDCPGLKCIYRILVDFQLNVKSDSIPLPDICAKTAKCYTVFLAVLTVTLSSTCTALERVLPR